MISPRIVFILAHQATSELPGGVGDVYQIALSVVWVKQLVLEATTCVMGLATCGYAL
jgi:hypothetical protein